MVKHVKRYILFEVLIIIISESSALTRIFILSFYDLENTVEGGRIRLEQEDREKGCEILSFQGYPMHS